MLNSLGRRLDRLPRIGRIKLPDTYESQWITLSGGKTRYVLTGDPASEFTVVLAPDPPNTIEQMAPLITLLNTEYQVLAFDMLGFGYSSFNRKYDFSMSQHSSATIELLQQLKIDNAILAMTCVAALPSLKAAKDHPELIHGLVLGQTPDLQQAKQWARRVDFKGMMGRALMGQIFLRLLRNKVAKLWYKNAFPKGYAHHGFADDTCNSFQLGARFSLASAFQALLKESAPTESFAALQPAVILWGKKDRSHAKTDPRKTLDLLPNGRLIQLETCGHFPDIEEPETFAKAVDEVVECIRARD